MSKTLTGITFATTSLGTPQWNALREWLTYGLSPESFMARTSSVSPNTMIEARADQITVEESTNNTRAAIPLFHSTLDVTTTGLGGLDSGSIATSSQYWVFAVGADSEDLAICNNFGLIASTSLSTPTMPSGFTHKRVVSWFATNASGYIIRFLHQDDEYEYEGRQLVYNTQSDRVKAELDVSGLVCSLAHRITVSCDLLQCASTSTAFFYTGSVATPAFYNHTDGNHYNTIDDGICIDRGLYLEINFGTTGTCNVYVEGFKFPIKREP